MDNALVPTALRLVGVQDPKGRAYAHRIDWLNGFPREGEVRGEALIESAIEMVRTKRLKQRAIVAVRAESLGYHEGSYLQALVRASARDRTRIMLQVEGTDFGMSSALAEFCSFAQRRTGVGIILKAEDCGPDELDSLLFSTGASIVCLGRSATHRARSRSQSVEVMDAMEIAGQYGACLMMEGLDTQADRVKAFESGVMLGSGKAICADKVMDFEGAPKQLTSAVDFVRKLTAAAA